MTQQYLWCYNPRYRPPTIGEVMERSKETVAAVKEAKERIKKDIRQAIKKEVVPNSGSSTATSRSELDEWQAYQKELPPIKIKKYDPLAKAKKTVKKGSAGIMVNREELPKNPEPEKQPEKPPEVVEGPPKPEGSYLLIVKARELEQRGYGVERIAKALGKTESWVKATFLILNKLPDRVLQAIATGRFSRLCALQLLMAPASNLEAIVDGALKISETEGKL